MDISGSLKKLDDHISLELARLNYIDKEGIDYRIDILRENIEAAEAEQEEISQRISSQEREYIAILGIFVAIIITFVGALSFSTSVLEGIGSVPTKTLFLTAILIGAVLLNAIFGLFYYIDAIVSKKSHSISPIFLIIPNVVLFILFIYIQRYT